MTISPTFTSQVFALAVVGVRRINLNLNQMMLISLNFTLSNCGCAKSSNIIAKTNLSNIPYSSISWWLPGSHRICCNYHKHYITPHSRHFTKRKMVAGGFLNVINGYSNKPCILRSLAPHNDILMPYPCKQRTRHHVVDSAWVAAPQSLR